MAGRHCHPGSREIYTPGSERTRPIETSGSIVISISAQDAAGVGSLTLYAL